MFTESWGKYSKFRCLTRLEDSASCLYYVQKCLRLTRFDLHQLATASATTAAVRQQFYCSYVQDIELQGQPQLQCLVCFQVSGILNNKSTKRAKMLFMNRERGIQGIQIPSASRGNWNSGTIFDQKQSGVWENRTATHLILNEKSKSFRKFNTTGHSVLIKFRAPCEEKTNRFFVCICPRIVKRI